MKKFFTLIAAVLFAGSMMAESVDFSAQGYENAQAIESYAGTNFSVAFAIGTNANNAPKYYTTGTAIRCYAGNTMTVSAASNITKIEITFGSGDGTNAILVAPGELNEAVWTGSAQSVVFTIDGTTGQRRIQALSVTLEGGETPVIDPWNEILFTAATNAGVFNDSVFQAGEFKLTCVDTENSKIKTTANDAAFGNANEYAEYNFRLQTGGKSGSKNSMNLTIPGDGYLRIAVRTGSNSDTTRTLVLAQGTDTLYNQAIKESDAVTVPLTDTTSLKVYPYIIVPVHAGTVAVGYPVNAINFYSFAYMPGSVPTQPKNLGPKTIAEFLELKNTTDTCILTGVVDSLVNTVYGNFNLIDASGKVYVYGLLTPSGEAKKFAELGVAEGDTLTVKALYNEYNNAPQAKNAIFVSVKNVPLTIPTEAPAAPTLDEADVMAVYCNHYTTHNANFGISGWAGAYQVLDLQGTNVGYWTGMTWECIIDPANTDAPHDFSAYQNVHVDFWAPVAAKIKFTAEAVAGGNYKDGVVVNLKKGWNSVDIALADWTGAYDFSNLKCFVLEQYQTPAGESFEGNPFAFANIYFWNAPAVQTITCAEVYNKAKGDAVVLNDVVVTFANGANVWVKDATGAMLIYLPSGSSVEWTSGDVLSGVAGAVDIYNGVTEVKPSADQVAAITATHGEAPAPEELTYVAATDVNKLIVVKGIQVEGTFTEGTASNININVGNQAIVLRNQFKNGFAFVSGQAYDIIAVVTIYQSNPQLYFIDAFEAQGIENVVLTEKVQKVMVDGVIYIVRDGKMFNAMGAQVR